MASRTNLIIKDRASTPVDHTFTPDGDDANGVHVFSEKTGVPAAASRFTAGLRSGNGKIRPTLRLSVPVVQTQTVNGVSNPVVVRTAFVEVNATFADTSTLQERKDAIGMMANALASSQTMIDELITGLTDIY